VLSCFLSPPRELAKLQGVNEAQVSRYIVHGEPPHKLSQIPNLLPGDQQLRHQNSYHLRMRVPRAGLGLWRKSRHLSITRPWLFRFNPACFR
jgi:hypothetical protein